MTTNLVSTVTTNNRFEHLTGLTGIEFNQQETTKTTKASTKDEDQVQFEPLEKKISQVSKYKLKKAS